MRNFRLRYRSQYFRQRLIIYGLIFLTLILIFGFIFSFIVFAWYAKDLPSPDKLSSTTASSTVFLDREGNILYEIYKDKNRVPVKFDEIPDYLKKATIAIEDKNFYKHQGISQQGIFRALFNTVVRGKIEGGSTITQQLIKNVLLDSRRSLSRKIKEVILAFEVERRYSKNQILQMYLNEAPYGGSYWGVGTASLGYFGKKVSDLSLAESVILAGLPQKPSYYSPFIGKNDSWKARAKDVLRRMREDGYITRAQELKTAVEIDRMKFNSPKITIKAPHFVFYVKDLVGKEFGNKMIDSGVKIRTSLSMKIQEKAEKIVYEEIKKIRNYNVTNAAVVIIDSKKGDILAMVGSYDFNDEKFGKFNAALGLRQPGSTVKPITYAVALEKGYTLATVLTDVKTVFPSQGGKDYIPENYDVKYRGPMQLRFALGNSINVVSVKLLAMIGVESFLKKAYEMGLTTFAPTTENLRRFGLSITLGGGETTLLDLTSAFSVFSSGGIKRETTAILEIADFNGKKMFKQIKTKEKRVLSPEVAFLISHALSDNNARMEVFGPRSYLNIPGKTVAVKTGTTDDKRDNWAVGYTKSLVVGVWVGNNDNSKMDPRIASGATGASPIFYRLMTELLKIYEDGIPEKPEKIKALNIDAFLGGLPKEGYPTRAEYFIEGSEPKEISPYYKKLKISKKTGKLANEEEIKRGEFEEKEFIIITETDPVSTDGKNRWQEAIYQWMKEQKDEKYHPPTEVSDYKFEPTPTVIPSLSPLPQPTASLTPTPSLTLIPSPT